MDQQISSPTVTDILLKPFTPEQLLTLVSHYAPCRALWPPNHPYLRQRTSRLSSPSAAIPRGRHRKGQQKQ